MAFTTLPAADASQPESMMLTEGIKFNDLGTSEADAPVGYRTSIVSPGEVTVTGCTAAYTGDYPELPTAPMTGPCDAAAEVVNN